MKKKKRYSKAQLQAAETARLKRVANAPELDLDARVPHLVAYRDRYIFWGVLLLAAALRFLTLGDRPFDGDEGVILKIAELPISQLLQAVAVDVHPPLYHLLVHGSISLFGVSEWSVRLVGVLAGIGLVALYPILWEGLHPWPMKGGWRAFAHQAAIGLPALGLLVAMNPFLVNLSQDTRMYSLLVFLATSSFALLWRAIHKTSRWWLWIGLGFVDLALVYTHHIGWLVLLLQLLSLVGVGSLIRRNRTGILRVALIVAIGYIPLLSLTIDQVKGRLAEQAVGTGFVDALSGVLGAIYRFSAGRTFLDINPGSLIELLIHQPLLFLGFLVTLLAPLWLLARGMGLYGFTNVGVPFHKERVAGWMWPVMFAVGKTTVIGSFVTALLVGTIGSQASRYLAYLVPLLAFPMALGIVRSWADRRQMVAVVLLALTYLAGLTTQYVRHNQSAGVDAYAQAIEAELAPGDAVLLRGGFAGGEERVFRYYLDRIFSTSEESSVTVQHLAGEGDSLPVIDLFADYDVRKSNLDELRAVDPVTKAVELLAQPDINRVWYFDNTYQQPTLIELPAEFIVDSYPLYLEIDKEGKQLFLTKVSER